MSTDRRQLVALAVVSALSTLVILAGGVGASSPVDTVALPAPRVANVAFAGAPVAAPLSETADDEVDVADEPTADDTAAADTDVDAGTGADDTDVGAVATSPTTATDTPAPAGKTAADALRPTHIEHVFEIVLAGQGPGVAFGAGAAATYLNRELRPKGALLNGYRSLGRSGLADHLALVSGQPPNADTRAGCAVFKEIPPATKATSGEIRADGCVYPNTVITLPDQLTARGDVWRAYVEDLDKGSPPVASCRRPASNAADDTVAARPGDAYGTRQNPFVYFHSLTDLGGCDASDGPLGRLEADLASAKTTPAFSYIVPDLCNSGAQATCPDDGALGGSAAADAFLALWVPKILSAPAFAKGLLVITFAGNVAPDAPDAPAANGALLVSPYVTAGSTADAELDPFALLRVAQDALALKPLAGSVGAPSLLDTVLAAARVARPGDD